MTDKLDDATENISGFPAIVILRLRNMTALDATGLHAIETLADRLRASGRTLLLCGARDQPAELISGTEFVEDIGPENILPNVQAAIDRARAMTENSKLRSHIRTANPALV